LVTLTRPVGVVDQNAGRDRRVIVERESAGVDKVVADRALHHKHAGVGDYPIEERIGCNADGGRIAQAAVKRRAGDSVG